jgi:hypothetical protein
MYTGVVPTWISSSSFLPAFDLAHFPSRHSFRAVRAWSSRAGALDTLRHRGICRSGSTFDPSWRPRKDIVLARFSRRVFSRQRVDVRWIYCLRSIEKNEGLVLTRAFSVIDGRYCQQIPSIGPNGTAVTCCLPCPLADWRYADSQ